MARLIGILNAMFAITLATAFAITVPPDCTLRDAQLYSLRANCSNEPWNGRYLVPLPSTGRLGLENFTVHPETPPSKFLPIRLHNDGNRYALRGGDTGDDLSRTPYLAAFTNNATHTMGLKIVYLPTPLRESFEAQPDACPRGYDCTADQWTLGDRNNNIYLSFEFGGFEGQWEPLKDAGKEGWHVYWKGSPGIHHPIQFDLVPMTEEEDGLDLICKDG